MIPAKKRVGIAGYLSRQPRTAVTKRPRTAGDAALVKRAIGKLPASKRPKAASSTTPVSGLV